MKRMSQRQIRVAEVVRQAVASTLGHKQTHNPLIDGMITVSDVWISPDLRTARVYFGCLTDIDHKSVTEALNAEAWYFQKAIAAKSTSKYAPKILFVYDDSIEKAEKIDASLRAIATKEVPV
jgi:ribosome-binding factor A